MDSSGGKQASKKKSLVNGLDPSVGKKTQFKPGQSGNPKGRPVGTKNLSTWIQELLNDEDFDQFVQHPTKGWVKETGAPIKAIIMVLITRAQQGDTRAFDMLAKYGYGTKVELSGQDGGPVEVKALVEFVGGSTDDDGKD